MAIEVQNVSGTGVYIDPKGGTGIRGQYLEANEIARFEENYEVAKTIFDLVSQGVLNVISKDFKLRTVIPIDAAVTDTREFVFTLNATQISNKNIVLSIPVLKEETLFMDISGAPDANPGIDFRVDPSDKTIVTWDGLGLDGLLVEGDEVRIVFQDPA